ncbi:hypothetical protein CDAR_224601 [Caerostris darwini]|uniref:Uncharacterized protein n=1 Tax=Caerostris darwini TaxID=1538125 RepID=A0AAV4QW96_9ARAC|nr:hypothetical protein CDAR_224601 [Caerostris darwini]
MQHNKELLNRDKFRVSRSISTFPRRAGHFQSISLYLKNADCNPAVDLKGDALGKLCNSNYLSNAPAMDWRVYRKIQEDSRIECIEFYICES